MEICIELDAVVADLNDSRQRDTEWEEEDDDDEETQAVTTGGPQMAQPVPGPTPKPVKEKAKAAAKAPSKNNADKEGAKESGGTQEKVGPPAQRDTTKQLMLMLANTAASEAATPLQKKQRIDETEDDKMGDDDV